MHLKHLLIELINCEFINKLPKVNKEEDKKRENSKYLFFKMCMFFFFKFTPPKRLVECSFIKLVIFKFKKHLNLKFFFQKKNQNKRPPKLI